MAFFTKEAQELIDYIGELNAKANGGFELTTDLKHWADTESPPRKNLVTT